MNTLYKLFNTLALTVIAVVASAQTLSVQDIEAKTGEQKTLTVSLSGASSATALQFNLQLPTGLTANTSGAALGAATNGHALSIQTLASGDLLCIIYSMDLKELKNGELLSIPVTVGNNEVNATGKLYTVRSSTAAAVSQKCSDANFNVTVTGTFSINKYKLTYTIDGEEYKSYEVEYGATITPEPAPTKEGYTFSGWSEIPETMPDHDVTVTGSFAINKYKLIYQVDGEEYKSYEIEFGASITPEAAPTKEGYTFSGWSEIPEKMPAHDVTVTGTFTINKYKLTYTVDGAEYKTYEVEYGATITPEPAPTKEGYTFSGWSETPETMPAHDVTVNGTFSINKYKLTYTVDGEEYKSYEVEYGATITPEAEPTKEGYTFSGWSEIPETMPAHDVTVTGTFTKGAYKLTYYVDGEVYKTVSYDYGATITPEAEPTKEGYTFSGWSVIPETMPAHDVTVTGTFSINKYKLTYLVDDAEYKTYEIEYGAAITPEAEPTKEGYTFSGWSDIPETMPAHDVNVSGSFTINQYTITYIIDNEVYTTEKVDYGSSITPPTPPSREGYDFAWGDYPETMPAHDITIYGTYTTGIDAIMVGECGDAKIYTLDGKQLEKPQKGLNIIRMSDGTVKKIVVK